MNFKIIPQAVGKEAALVLKQRSTRGRHSSSGIYPRLYIMRRRPFSFEVRLIVCEASKCPLRHEMSCAGFSYMSQVLRVTRRFLISELEERK